MYMVKIQKFCNNNNDNLNKKGNTVLCTLHLMSDAFGTYKNFVKNSGHSLELLLQYWTTKENTSEFNIFSGCSYSYVKCIK